MKRNKLVVFEEIIGRITEKPERGTILFGEKDYCESDERYDLVFHAKSGLDLSEIERVSSIIIPVLDGRKMNKDELYPEIAKSNSKNNIFNRFAISHGNGIDIYDVIKREAGVEISPLDDEFYKIPEKVIFESSKEIDIHKDIINKRKRIDEYLKNHAALTW